MKQKTNMLGVTSIIVLFIASFIFLSLIVKAEPEGATVQYMSNSTKNSSAGGYRQDAKGTITTVLMSTVQQNIKWKAYVGNVSGTLVLRDAEDYSIYEWASGGNPDGEVYITRNSTIDWSNIQCANYTQISAEETNLGHSNTAVDNINSTFSHRTHQAFEVGVVPIAISSCKSTATWVNSTSQSITTSSLFQEVLLMDLSNKIVYTSLIDQNTRGFNNQSYYDFQAIVPDSTGAAVSTYYFYVEISG